MYGIISDHLESANGWLQMAREFQRINEEKIDEGHTRSLVFSKSFNFSSGSRKSEGRSVIQSIPSSVSDKMTGA